MVSNEQAPASRASRSFGWIELPAVCLLAIAFALILLVADDPTLAQDAGRSPASSMVDSTPIPEGDIAATVKQLGLVESERPVREMVKDWRRPRKIIVFVEDAVTHRYNVNRLAWLQEAAPGVKLVPVHNQAEALREIVDADAQLRGGCSKPLIEAGKILHWVQLEVVGVEGCLTGDAPQKLMDGTVVLTNIKRIVGRPIADHAIAMMMALSRGLDLWEMQQLKKHFDRSQVPPDRLWEIQGKTMLVVGLGGIGNDVASMGHALGMKVIATRASSHEGPDFVDYVGLANELPDLIGKADVVIVAAPLTPESKNMFNAAMFARMKKGALFINVTRGGEVVQADLENALKSGQVGGAGLDTATPEGLAMLPDDPLFSTPNVIFTPHVAGLAFNADDAGGGEFLWQIARENLRRYVIGDKLLSVVNPQRGY